MVDDSRIPGFYKLSREERVKKLKEVTGLGDEDLGPLLDPGKVDMEVLDHMIENVVGTMTLPLGIATNFLINDRDYLIPMAIEEPSVVAAASNLARMTRDHGGFTATDTGPNMIGQIQVVEVLNPEMAKTKIMEAKEELLAFANEQDPILVRFGGGAKDVRVRIFDTKLVSC